MKLPAIKTRAGQYTWLQVLCLAISVGAYALGTMAVAIVMLLAGTIFGVVATYARVQQSKTLRQQPVRYRRPR